jgi:hypothetical protein
MNRIIWLLCISYFGLLGSAKAQQKKASNFQEGVIIYELNLKGFPGGAENLNGTTLSLYFKGEQTKMDLSFLQGMARFQVINRGKNSSTLLTDIPFLSEKSAVSFDPQSEEWKKMQEQALKNQAPQEVELNLTPHKRDKKKIAKHRCYRASVGANQSMGGAAINLYISKDIRPEGLDNFRKTMKWPELEGLPLGMEVKMGDMTVTLMAKEIRKGNVADTVFEVSKDYQNKTLEELKNGFQEKIGGSGTTPGGVGM